MELNTILRLSSVGWTESARVRREMKMEHSLSLFLLVHALVSATLGVNTVQVAFNAAVTCGLTAITLDVVSNYLDQSLCADLLSICNRSFDVVWPQALHATDVRGQGRLECSICNPWAAVTKEPALQTRVG